MARSHTTVAVPFAIAGDSNGTGSRAAVNQDGFSPLPLLPKIAYCEIQNKRFVRVRSRLAFQDQPYRCEKCDDRHFRFRASHRHSHPLPTAPKWAPAYFLPKNPDDRRVLGCLLIWPALTLRARGAYTDFSICRPREAGKAV
jgi:hypothetical protein